MRIADPLKLVATWWPSVQLYDKQREALYSLWYNDETVVPAGNMLGKDFIAALGILLFFLSRNPCRIVTTSAKDEHLDVLWGEMNSFIASCAKPLLAEDGGPLIRTHHQIKKLIRGPRPGQMIECPKSYIKGMVANDKSIASMGGHHIAATGDGVPRTLFVVDEASSVPDSYYDKADPWANRILIIGNTWDCSNFFYHAIKGKPGTDDRGGNILRDKKNPKLGFYRKVIKIVAEDSPNVKLALMQIARGMKPTGEIIVPGVKSWQEYSKNMARWDEIKKCIALHADFYEGKEIKMFPPTWLARANAIADSLREKRGRQALAIGIDSGEGAAYTSMTATDQYGIIEQDNQKTGDTSVITGNALAFAHKWGCEDQNIIFDAGGGGLQHADRLRAQGHPVRSVMFGEAATPVDKFKRTYNYRGTQAKIEDVENRYVYKNRRAEMYGIFMQLLDPENEGFGIPSELVDLLFQLSKFPKTYDEEGRLFLPPKRRKPGTKKDDLKPTLTELIGRSPDEADSTALAIFGMYNQQTVVEAGAVA